MDGSLIKKETKEVEKNQTVIFSRRRKSCYFRRSLTKCTGQNDDRQPCKWKSLVAGDGHW
ncbi:hypothetical protein LINGRAHAP2_LOCUS18272, partial [Linum grandiflorum]